MADRDYAGALKLLEQLAARGKPDGIVYYQIGVCQTVLGRFEEAEDCFDPVLEIEENLLDPTVRLIPHLGYIDLAWCRGDAVMAEQHASRVAEIAEKHESPYLRVFAFACGGTA